MAEAPLDVLILWHMHQPYYKDLRTGRMAMPWVRLHGTKDYLDMVLLVQEFPKIHVNINWVPSLLDQIAQYASGEASDRELDLSRANPEGMDDEAKIELLKTHFAAHGPRMIDPQPRYAELRRLRGNPTSEAGWRLAAKRFRPQDLRDTQVWMNLAWIDPLLRRRDPFLQGLAAKGSGFSEEEKAQLLERQRAILAQIIPATARAWDCGAIEVSVSPYYHPILPLLCDTNFARRARPQIPLPQRRFSHPEDAAGQISAALERAEALFGRRPRGMWPSEGSVCDEIAPILAQAGVEWIATDEEVLAQSLGLAGFTRDKMGNVVEADRLYRAYRRSVPGASVALVFRDHVASDLIGFQFSSWSPETAAEALIAKLEEIQRRVKGVAGAHAASIILDGENCWEYYAEDGGPFLRAFYGRLSQSSRLRSVTISQHLAEAGALKELPKLHSGSWINHDYGVWIGHPEDNTSWDLLTQAREAYEERTKAEPAPQPEALAKARQSLWVAEGSDWNWWYGDDHDSGNNAAFDALYREHLSNVYRFLGLEAPSRLDTPILRPRAAAGLVMPRGFISPKIEGRTTSYFEWFGGGLYDPLQGYGAMHPSGETLLGRLCFGFDLQRLYVRIDLAGRRRWKMAPSVQAAVLIFAKQTWKIEVANRDGALAARLLREEAGAGWIDEGPLEEVAADWVLELAVPFARLGLRSGEEFGLQAELSEAGGVSERRPPSSPIALQVPDADFEAKMWVV